MLREQIEDILRCQDGNQVDLCCVTRECKGETPFLCNNSACSCGNSHQGCHVMKWEQVEKCLLGADKMNSNPYWQLIARLGKVYESILERIDSERRQFYSYVQQIRFDGAVHLVKEHLQEGRYSQLTSRNIAFALQAISNEESLIYQTVTLQETRHLDNLTQKLLQTVQKLYKSKIGNPKSQSSLSTRPTVKKEIQYDLIGRERALLADFTYPRVIQSRIVGETAVLNRLINKRIVKYNLVYRASENGFKLNRFYESYTKDVHDYRRKILDKVKPYWSLVLLKTEFGKVLGGVTAVDWDYLEEDYLAHSDDSGGSEQQLPVNPESSIVHTVTLKNRKDLTGSTFLFSLDLVERYALTDPEQAIYCAKNSIGFGKDLRWFDRADKSRKNHCGFPSSFNNASKPYEHSHETTQMLIGNKYSDFYRIAEWEVHHIIV